jgi:hypothetical protein
VSHMVIFRSTDGRPGYHQADELDEAVAYVERLRNEEGVEHARIFRLDEVTFEFRPYFRVAIAPPEPAAPPMPMAVAPVAPVAPAVEHEPIEAPAPADGSPDGLNEPGHVPMAPMVDPDTVPVVPLGGNGAVPGRRGLFGR